MRGGFSSCETGVRPQSNELATICTLQVERRNAVSNDGLLAESDNS